MKLTKAQRRVLKNLTAEQAEIEAGAEWPRYRKSYPCDSGIWWKLIRRGLAVVEMRQTAFGQWLRVWVTERGLSEAQP